MSSNTSMTWAWSNGSDKIDICEHLRKLVVEEWLSHSIFLQAISHRYSDIWSGSKSIFEEWTLCSWFRQFNASGNGKFAVFANRCYDTDGQFTSIANYSKGLYAMYANFHCLWPVKCRALWCCHPNNTLGAILWGWKICWSAKQEWVLSMGTRSKKGEGHCVLWPIKKRCKCFQEVRSCTDNSHCLGCENPYGKKNLLSAQDWNKHRSKKKEASSDEFGKHTRKRVRGEETTPTHC